MNKKKIVCLMGESGSGKTEIGKMLDKMGYDVLQSYTTRKPRYDNEWGHIFCTFDEYEKFRITGEIAAYNFIDGNHYFCTKEQISKTDVYIVDPEGIKNLKNNIRDIEVVTIYLNVDQDTRFERMQARGDTMRQMLQRIFSDKETFKNKEFDYAIKNDDLKKTVKMIAYIMNIENI